MSILHFNECLRLMLQNKNISQVSNIIRFQPKTIKKLLKISTTDKGDFVKKFKKSVIVAITTSIMSTT
ncbi:hypothetical protein [Mycoplasmopsis anatis]|uniref:hypothetical protein n=2 Tax=Mycoplasmopsis anatis TaxID=171279 RepID=UPI001C4E1636|nr:hypothetical protein [Mycoplasmopsis anatis]